MRYAQIRNADVLNGTGIGCTLLFKDALFIAKDALTLSLGTSMVGKNGHKKLKTLSLR